MQTSIPSSKPANPRFCSGPCAKHPAWNLSDVDTKWLSRSHRSPLGVGFIRALLEQTREVLGIPESHRIMFTPGSATGAITMAMWNFLGSRPVDVVCNDVFSERWMKEAELLGVMLNRHHSDYGQPPNLDNISELNDILFVWHGTSTGTSISDVSWLPQNHKGLTLCDATSAAFCLPLPWEKLDLTCFSLQKGMGGEAGVGVLVISNPAFQTLQEYTPSWPVPYIFNLKEDGRVREDVFDGVIINTPSLLTLSDYASGLAWAKANGGGEFLFDRTRRNFRVLNSWVDQNNDLEYFISTPKYRSLSTSCVQIISSGKGLLREQYQSIAADLASKSVAYDILGFKSLPPMFRIWTGPTIESRDLEILTEWLSWSIKGVLSEA